MGAELFPDRRSQDEIVGAELAEPVHLGLEVGLAVAVDVALHNHEARRLHVVRLARLLVKALLADDLEGPGARAGADGRMSLVRE